MSPDGSSNAKGESGAKWEVSEHSREVPQYFKWVSISEADR